MKLAVVCSYLTQYGGAERVLEVIHQMYPEAPVYTSMYLPDRLPDDYRTWDIRTTCMQRLPFKNKLNKAYLPLYPRAFEKLDFSGYDTVLSVTSGFAHGIVTPESTRHVCYCLTPARFLWNFDGYVAREGMGSFTRSLLPGLIRRLARWDCMAAERVDDFVAISTCVQQRIQNSYGRESSIIYPPVRIPEHYEPADVGDYYLVVSRLIPYKRIDLAVRAFTKLGIPLHIIGDGRDRAALEAEAGPKVSFLGFLSDDEVAEEMRHCRAFVFPGEEDFGITPVEVMGRGRPVVAYKAGGALDTVVEGLCGTFFDEPTPESLAEAIQRIEEMTFDSEKIVAHARRFEESHFCEALRQELER